MLPAQGCDSGLSPRCTARLCLQPPSRAVLWQCHLHPQLWERCSALLSWLCCWKLVVAKLFFCVILCICGSARSSETSSFSCVQCYCFIVVGCVPALCFILTWLFLKLFLKLFVLEEEGCFVFLSEKCLP